MNTDLSVSYSSFFKCLCDARKKTCLQRYTQRQESVRDFEVDGTAESEDMSEDDEIGNMFLCNPGGFEINNYLSCTRWSDTLARCDGARHCQSYHLEMDYDFCRSKCLKLDWQHYPMKVKNFGKFPRFGKGSSCGIDATTSTNTDRNLTSHSPTPDNRSLKAVAISGWAVVALLLGIIILMAYIIYSMRKSPNTTNPVNPGDTVNGDEENYGPGFDGYEIPQTENSPGNGNRWLDTRHLFPASSSGINGRYENVELQPPTDEYNTID